jgi:replicative DNA helicase
MHRLDVSGHDDLQTFFSEIGSLGARRNGQHAAIVEQLSIRRPNTNRDVVPKEAWRSIVVPAMRPSGITQRGLQSALGMSYCGATLYKHGLSRGRALQVSEVVESAALEQLATSDVYWDEIVSIEPDGEDDVFDLTVEGLHSFVADDIVVHNSIEQDADIVCFIYRDEYYNGEESDQQGLAEVIVAKHRNGPTDTVKLSFLKRYAKFTDLAAV